MLKCTKTELYKQRLQEPMGKKFVAQYVSKNGVPCMAQKHTGNSGHVSECGLCPVCGLQDNLTRHHLRPKAQVGSDIDHSVKILKLCHVCHKFLHKTFTNEALEAQLFNLEAILADQQVSQHIKTRRRDARNGVPLAHPRKDA